MTSKRSEADIWDEFFTSAHDERLEAVESPKHYTNKQIEVIDYIDDTVPDCYSFYFGNALKYLSGHLNKGKPVQDLQKCIWYIERMIKDNK